MSAWFDDHQGSIASSDLLRTELIRAVRRDRPHAIGRARSVLDSITLLTIPTERFEDGADVGPVELRGLDALHVASARQLGDHLDGLVAYDSRLLDAARRHGIAAVSPGADVEEVSR